jgi:hypothetical protein
MFVGMVKPGRAFYIEILGISSVVFWLPQVVRQGALRLCLTIKMQDVLQDVNQSLVACCF